MKKRLIVLLCLLIVFFGIWLIVDFNLSYAEAETALEIPEGDYVVVQAYERNGEALFFIFNEHKDMGAKYVSKGWFGWKTGESTWVGLNDVHLDKFYGYSELYDQLIFGLLENMDDKKVLVNGQQANVLNLDGSPDDLVEEFGLQDLTIWYVELEDDLEEGFIELIDEETGEVLDQMEIGF